MAEKSQKKMINVRLNPELWQRAKAAAGAKGLTLERWVTDALEAHLDQDTDGSTSEGSDLAWRVAALEQAVDYLASTMGAGFPDRPIPPRSTSGTASP